MPLVYPALVWLVARWLWIGAPGRGLADRARVAGRGCCSRRRCSSPASGSASTCETSNVIDVGYSGVIGAERIVARPGAVGPLPGRGQPARRAGRRTLAARSATTSRRTAAASRRTRRATRTARSPTRRTSRAISSSGGAGSGTSFPPAHFTSILFDLLCDARAVRSSGRRFGGLRLAATLAFAWVAYPFTQYVVELEHERRDHAVPARLRLLARRRRPSGAGTFGALARLDEVRARSSSSPLWSTYPDARVAAARASLAGFAGRDARGVLRRAARAEPAARSCASSATTRSPTQFGRDSPFSLWDWRQYHAKGLPDLHLGAARAPGVARRRRARVAWLAAAQVAAPARRAHRGAARRLRARADVLALHVHPLVLPFRGDRVPRTRRRPHRCRTSPAGATGDRPAVA